MQELKQEYISDPIKTSYPSILYEAYLAERSGLFKNTASIVNINTCRNKILELDNKYDRMAMFINNLI